MNPEPWIQKRRNEPELDELGYLSNAAVRLAELRPDEDVFTLIAEMLATLAPGCLVTTSSFDPHTDSLTVRAAIGPPEMIRVAREAIGRRDLIGLVLHTNEDARRSMAHGKLVRLEHGLRDLTFETWPLEVTRRVEAELKIRSVHAQSFARRGDFLGTAGVISTAFRLGHARLIEAVTRLAAVAIQRQRFETRLRASELALIEADRRKNEFLAVLSHELRNPLMPIKNGLYILSRNPTLEQADRIRTIMDRQVGHLSRLVDDLLDVTRITRGKIRLHQEPLELNQLVRATVDDHRSIFTDKSIALELTPAKDDVWIRGDNTRIAQVVGNLLQNAAKFTPAGGRTSITLSTDSSAKQAVLQIEDTGAGIAPEILRHVFEPFTQADRTIDRSKGGLGLGLMLVKGLVEMHGGTVSVRSEGHGAGTALTVRLPLEAKSQSAPEPVSVAEKDAQLRVLIVEDNVDAAETMRDALGLRHNVVEIAFTGPEGIEKARALRPDIVLCDIGLPGLDGYEVAQAIREIPELRGVVLVAVTGYASPEDIAKARLAGFDRHLCKPPAIDVLQRIIDDLARSKSAQMGARD